MKLVYILLAAALIRGILLYKTFRSIPAVELKRRARQQDKKAAALYKVASYGPELYVRQWLFCTIVAAVLIIWSARTEWWLAATVIMIISWLSLALRAAADGWAGSLAAFFAPFDQRILSFIHPIVGPIAKRLSSSRRQNNHTGLYEKSDLLEVLGRQNKQSDSRIHEGDLQIAANAMTFGDKLVRETMTPRRVVKIINVNDSVGPLLMDDLHKSGFSRFPVVKDSVKSASPQIVGTLYLNNLIGYEGGGKVKDLMKPEVYFINEDCNLRQALNAFLKTHHHLLIVINSFEEMVGVISLEDVLEQILGKQIIDEFDSYKDLRAVATMNAEKETAEHMEIKPEQSAPAVIK